MAFLKQPEQRALFPLLLATDLLFCSLQQLYLYRGQDEEWDALGPAMVNCILLGQQSQHADHPSERGQDNGWETFLITDSDATVTPVPATMSQTLRDSDSESLKET